jgi:hypothetical protein
MKFVKARGILQYFAILSRKSVSGRIRRGELRNVSAAQALNRDGENQVKADMFHAYGSTGIFACRANGSHLVNDQLFRNNGCEPLNKLTDGGSKRPNEK